MPGEDRSGPLGKGPRTGRGLGRCGPGTTRQETETTEAPPVTDDAGIPPRGRGPGRGFGRGTGRGPGRGRGRGNW
jgi:hypothetical protein